MASTRVTLTRLLSCTQRFMHILSNRERVGTRMFHQGKATALVSKRDLERLKNEKILTVKYDKVFHDLERTEKEKNAYAFTDIIEQYKAKEGVYRRGHVEFIYTAMARMKDYNVNKDLNAYKALLLVFPQGVMRAKSIWEVDGVHYPKQQQCAIDIMEHMERHRVCPDDEFGQMLDAVFGTRVHAFRKYRRMIYWMPKMKHVNPYPLPRPLPTDAAELAVVALKRMAVDLENRVSVHRPEIGAEHIDRGTFIASSQSPTQQGLIARHTFDRPLYVEGAYTVWTGPVLQSYFILSADPRVLPPPPTKDDDSLDVDKWTNMFDDENLTRDVTLAPSIHELADRTVMGMCITDSASKDSLMSWIKILQETNEKLNDALVVFQLRSKQQGLEVCHESTANKSALSEVS